MTHRWIVTAVGKDRPGIVSGVTEVLYAGGCNLEDSAMTRLEGEFAIMLIFSTPKGVSETALRRAFGPLERRMKLAVELKSLTKQEGTFPTRKGKPYSLSVYGADQPGIVYRVSKLLAENRINITNVETHRSANPKGSKHKPLYVLLLEVEFPVRSRSEGINRKLKRLAKSLGVEITLHAAEADVM